MALFCVLSVTSCSITFVYLPSRLARRKPLGIKVASCGKRSLARLCRPLPPGFGTWTLSARRSIIARILSGQMLLGPSIIPTKRFILRPLLFEKEDR
jgi:hypothetical protein